MAHEAKYGLSALEAMTVSELEIELEAAEERLFKLELGAVASGEVTLDQLALDAQRQKDVWDSI